MLEGVRRVCPAVDNNEADVPAKGLWATGLVLDVVAGPVEGRICGARVVNRRPVDSPMTWEKGL